MKALFFKNRMPIAMAVLAILVAFATSSMQSADKSFAMRIGYSLNAQGMCNTMTICCDIPISQVCRLSYPTGARAFGEDPQGYCTETLWRCIP